MVAPTTPLHFLKAAWVEVAAIELIDLSRAADSFTDRAPPGGASFIENFLSRRMLSHAPPLGVA